jgi:hypothetical protein
MFQTIERPQRDQPPARSITLRHKNTLIYPKNNFVAIVIISLLGLAISLLYIERNEFYDIEYMVGVFNSL